MYETRKIFLHQGKKHSPGKNLMNGPASLTDYQRDLREYKTCFKS